MILPDNHHLLVQQFNNKNVYIYGSYDLPLLKKDDILSLLDISLEDQVASKISQVLLCESEIYIFLNKFRTKKSKQFTIWVNETFKQLYKFCNKETCVYVASSDIKDIYKIGKSHNTIQRVKGLQTSNVNDIKILFKLKTTNCNLLEKMVHHMLHKYRCHKKREYFKCNLEYIIKIMIFANNCLNIDYIDESKIETINNLLSEKENTEEDNNKINEQRYDEPIEEDSETDQEIDEDIKEKTENDDEQEREYIELEYFNKNFIEKCIEKKIGGGINWIELWNLYKKCFCKKFGYVFINKTVTRQYFEKNVFKKRISYISDIIGKGWSGYRIKNQNEHSFEEELATSKNDFYKWLDKHVVFTNNFNDYMSLKNIYDLFLQTDNFNPKLASKYKKKICKYIKNKYNNNNLSMFKQYKTKTKKINGWRYFKINIENTKQTTEHVIVHV